MKYYKKIQLGDKCIENDVAIGYYINIRKIQTEITKKKTVSEGEVI